LIARKAWPLVPFDGVVVDPVGVAELASGFERDRVVGVEVCVTAMADQTVMAVVVRPRVTPPGEVASSE